MPKYIDDNGNETELNLSLEQINGLNEEKTKLSTDLEETKAKLAGLENKDFNFKRLENLTKEEMAKLSSREIELMKRQEALEDTQKQFTKKQTDSYKEIALARFGISDPETRAKVMAQYDRLKDEASTEDEIYGKMKDAVTVATGRTPGTSPNPVFSPGGYGNAPSRSIDPGITQDLLSLASRMGVTAEDFKKYSK